MPLRAYPLQRRLLALSLQRWRMRLLSAAGSLDAALARYDEFHESHRRKFEVMLAGQRVVPRVPPRLLHHAIGAMQAKRFVDWSFGHYLNIAPPSFVTAGPARRPVEQLAA